MGFKIEGETVQVIFLVRMPCDEDLSVSEWHWSRADGIDRARELIEDSEVLWAEVIDHKEGEEITIYKKERDK